MNVKIQPRIIIVHILAHTQITPMSMHLALFYSKFSPVNCPTVIRNFLLQVHIKNSFTILSIVSIEILIFMVGSGKMKPNLGRLNPKLGFFKNYSENLFYFKNLINKYFVQLNDKNP